MSETIAAFPQYPYNLSVPTHLMTIVMFLQVLVSMLLILCILVQHRASGLTSTFGGSGATYVQRRGAEKVIFKMTVWLSVAFFALSIAQWYFPA
jgi:protein translocase SecG subunit